MSLRSGGTVIEQRLPDIITQQGRKRTHGAGEVKPPKDDPSSQWGLGKNLKEAAPPGSLRILS